MDFSVGHFIFFICFTIKTSIQFPTSNNNATSIESTSTIQPDAGIHPQHLSQMSMGLKEIPVGSPRIKTINLAYNNLDCLPAFVFSNKLYRALTKIELSNNYINNISEFAFVHLTHLTYVDLSNNNISSLDSFTFKSNTNLRKLDLSFNKIHFEHGHLFLKQANLEILILSNNEIGQIFEINFARLPNLKHLYLDHNPLKKIAYRSFMPHKRIETLSLGYTEIDHLTMRIFNNVPRILDITGTPLAQKFTPPLGIVLNEAVEKVLNIDEFESGDVDVIN